MLGTLSRDARGSQQGVLVIGNCDGDTQPMLLGTVLGWWRQPEALGTQCWVHSTESTGDTHPVCWDTHLGVLGTQC